MEEWRAIAGFDGYEVSNLGRVRSWRPKNGIGGFVATPRVLSPETNKHGYKRIGLRILGERKKRGQLIHQLVLEAFVCPKPAGLVCCHGDGDRTNNAVGNLRWDTPAANAQDSIRHGTTARGDRNGSRLHPERLVRGDRHHSRLRPETRPRGDEHFSRRKPECLARGEGHGNATITDQLALEIFRASGTYQEIADRLGATRGVVAAIKAGKTWKHVTGGRHAA